MNTYLIQRGTFTNRDGKGIDTILSFDYMGSAEFEFGELPQSLKRIRAHIIDYTYLDVPIKDKVITVFCTNEQKSEMKHLLTQLSGNKIHLKERSDFNTYTNPSEHDLDWQKKRPHKTDFWWDIDNDFMFWKKNNEFEVKFKKLIEV
jgi:hypothetical protein